jgi:putative alpha-1,2-mannosidase
MPYYVLGSPLFDNITVTGPAGKKFTIQAKGQSDTHRYIQSAKLNGKPFTRSYLLHDEIAKGGQLVLEMSSKPNPAWASSPADVPPSMGMESK